MKRNAITSTTTTGRNGSSVAAANVASNGSSVAAANVASNGSSVAAPIAAAATSRVSELRKKFEQLASDATAAVVELKALVESQTPPLVVQQVGQSPPRPVDEPPVEPEEPEDQKPDPLSINFPLQVSEKLEGEYKNLAHWPREARNQLETDLILWEELFTGQPKKKQKEIRKSLLLALKHAATAAAPAAPVPTTKAAPAAAKAAVPKEEFPTLPKPATAPTARPPSFAQMAARPQTEEAQRLAAQQLADAKKKKEDAERARGGHARAGHARGRVDVWSAAAQGAASKSLYRQQLKEVVSQESMEAGKYLASLQAHVENALPHLAKMLVNAILAHAGYDQRGVSYLKTNIRWWDEDAAAEENKRRRHRWGESAKLVQAHSEEHLPTYVAILDITEEMFETFSGEYGLDLSALIAHTPTCAELTLLMSERYASCQDRVFHTRFHVSLPERGQIKCTVVKLSDRHAREYKSEVEAKAAAKAAALQAADDAENARKAAQAARAEANGGWGSAA